MEWILWALPILVIIMVARVLFFRRDAPGADERSGLNENLPAGSDQGDRKIREGSMEGIVRLELEPPVSIDLPVEDQIDLIFERASHRDWNDTFATQHGFAADTDLSVISLDALLPHSDPRNRELLMKFIRGGYQCTGGESCEFHQSGNSLVFLNNWDGTVVGGQLVEIRTNLINITAQKNAADALRARSEFEGLIGRLSTRFINLPVDNISSAIEEALGEVGRFLKADRTYFCEESSTGSGFRVTNAWYEDDVEELTVTSVESAEYPWVIPKLERGDVVLVRCAADIEAVAPAGAELMRANGAESMILVPVRIEDRLVGFMGLDKVREAGNWAHLDLEILRTAGPMLAGAIQRGKAAKALSLSEERFAQVFRASPDAIAITRAADGLIVEVNDGFEQVFGFKRDEVIGHTTTELNIWANPEDRPDSIEAILDGRPTDAIEFRWRTKSGKIILCDWSGQRIEFDGVQHILGVARDISAHREAQDALKASEEKFALSFRASPDSITLNYYDDGVLFEVNDGFSRITGYSHEEAIGRSADELGIWRNARQYRHLLANLRRDGEIRDYDIELLTKNQDTVDVEISAELIELDHRQCVLTVTRDITERKQAENALADSEARFRALVEHAAEAIVVFDLDQGVFVSANNNALKLFRCDLDTLLTLGPGDVSPPYQPDGSLSEEAAGALIGRTVAGEPQTFEWMHRDLEGNDRLCEIRLVRYPPETQRLVRGSISDISERKRAEKERARLELQLRQAQKMEAIGQLTGGIAHDFNNILASILGYTELAQSEPGGHADTEISTYLAEVHRAGLRARDLVAKMLTFSRRQGDEARPMYVASLVNDVISLLRPTLPSTIEFRTRVEENLPAISIDPVQFEQAMLNLCINARDAMDGRGIIEIELNHSRDTDVQCTSCQEIIKGDQVEIVINDTGTGISKDAMARIFEPFYSSKDFGEGSGMGLAMVHGIAHSHGGHIVADSDFGKGARFRLYFPTVEDAQKSDDPDEPRASPRRGDTVSARILVVDDEPAVGNLMGRLLENRGFAATVLTDGNDALEYFLENKNAVDLVVTDYTMPGMTGVELAGEILTARPDMPIILCTGYSSDVDEHRAKALGIRGYHSKPIDIDAFCKQVGDLVGVST